MKEVFHCKLVNNKKLNLAKIIARTAEKVAFKIELILKESSFSLNARALPGRAQAIKH